MAIIDLLKNKNYIIVLDTNVFLNIYRFSPEFSVFALECLKTVKKKIFLPATVQLEFYKHNNTEFAKMKNRVASAGSATKTQIQQAKQKILTSCMNFDRLKFPDIDELKSVLTEKIDDLEKSFDDFFEDRNILNFISDPWEGQDELLNFVKELETLNHVMDSPSQQDLYNWCAEGESRYKKQIPPGFKDSKNKDGIRKYSDLILWKEILRYAKTNKVNVIFVTDDVKPDWWESNQDKLTFHEKLIQEFNRTGQTIQPYISSELFREISSECNIPVTDVVDIALNISDNDYFESVKDEIFNEFSPEITYSYTTYIDVASSHIGSVGMDELEVEDYTFLSAERVDRYDDIVTYNFRYLLTVSGTSYEYWGRDDDTREIITSPGRNHEFEGEFIVQVQRKADIFLDYTCDSSFISVEILSGDLREINYHDVFDYDEPGELGYCPDCGCPLDFDNDVGNGFCSKCAWKH
ncbi:MAG: PIN domain-containing protein [Acutalibacteraceae bacterium]|nr:PIN domain-containing protein [Acutalibacteraceae bacterium]